MNARAGPRMPRDAVCNAVCPLRAWEGRYCRRHSARGPRPCSADAAASCRPAACCMLWPPCSTTNRRPHRRTSIRCRAGLVDAPVPLPQRAAPSMQRCSIAASQHRSRSRSQDAESSAAAAGTAAPAASAGVDQAAPSDPSDCTRPPAPPSCPAVSSAPWLRSAAGCCTCIWRCFLPCADAAHHPRRGQAHAPQLIECGMQCRGCQCCRACWRGVLLSAAMGGGTRSCCGVGAGAGAAPGISQHPAAGAGAGAARRRACSFARGS